MSKQVLVLGMGMSGREQRHNLDRLVEGYDEVIGMNNGYTCYPEACHAGAFTKWFEIHELSYLETWSKPLGQDHAYFRALDALNIPVVTSEKLPVIRDQVSLDEIDIAMHFGANFWDGTPSRILAHLCYLHDKGDTVGKIAVYGIDMQDTEHAGQQPYWAYWIAQLQCRGITLGGTILGFLQPETDAGTRNIRDRVTVKMRTLSEET